MNVFFMGGLGNQLWLASYAYKLSKSNSFIGIDSSWYQPYSRFFFSKNRTLRVFEGSFILSLSPKFQLVDSPFSLLKYKVCRALPFARVNSYTSYHQDSDNLSDEFFQVLSRSIIQYSNHLPSPKDYNNSIALHLRMGDRGSTFSPDELSSLRIVIKRSSQLNLLVFSDEPLNAINLLATHFPGYSFSLPPDDLNIFSTMLYMSLCAESFFLRPSTFSFWSSKISNFLLQELT